MAFFVNGPLLLQYRLLGDEAKPLLVLSHPLGMSQQVWDACLDRLQSRYRLLSWDLPGHGASGPVTAIDVATLSNALLALIDSLDIARFSFCGTSIGGVIGQQLLMTVPERLKKAFLTNTGAVIGSPQGWQERIDAINGQSLAALAGQLVVRWFSPRSLAKDSALASGWQQQLARTDQQSYIALCQLLAAFNSQGQMQANKVAVKLLAGSDDASTPPATLQALANHLPGATLTVLDGVGHVPSIEAPQAFCDWLLG
ncbi:alpha/beta fold hydrolase [Gallaecimonas mangrovi]|uniref:alpha/beta fold hydrolase n=1 Tax=Gallaecimonas mangrovi TaxID=2291597 RepID=UPI000E204120|nr:alpha/beta fold hydrolase [Gallaecimonas mangrovi]